MFGLGSCNEKLELRSKNADQETSETGSETPASSYSPSITLLSPATSPSTEKSPTLRATGLVVGDTIKLFSDSGCTTEIASETAAGSSVDLTTTNLSVGVYDIYATAEDIASTKLPCTDTGIDYEVQNPPPSDFISIWSVGAGDTVRIPTRWPYNYNMTIDWGDGSPTSEVTAENDPDREHTYASAGTYTITIGGSAEALYFNNDTYASKIIEVVNLGSLGWINLESAFKGCVNLTDFAGGDTSSVTDMSDMFFGASSLVNTDFSSFDTSNVTDMSYMFADVSNILSLDLSGFDTTSVTTMEHMFSGMDSVQTLNLSGFNTMNVVDMQRMFYENYDLVNLDISNFQTGNVTTMNSMFYKNNSLVTLDLSHFDTTSVTDMRSMFQDCISLDTLDISSFSTPSLMYMSGMFYGSSSLTTLDMSGFNTSGVTNMDEVFAYAAGITGLDLSSFDTSSVVSMVSMFNGTSSMINLNADGWDVSNVSSSNYIFNSKNPALVVECDQGGSPGTGSLFGETCN